jgi:multidrug efflux pump subunit AcrA (membrane-fusion protein)
MTSKKRNIYIVAGLIAVILLFRAGQKILSSKKAAGGGGEAVAVATAKAERKDIEETLDLTGDIRGLNEARLYPRVPGRLLRKIKDAGDIVKKGDVVALVDRDEPALKFAAAEVTSPLSGVLTRYFVDLGQDVTPATPVCEVADVSPIKVVVSVTEKDFPRVRLGLAARFDCDAYPGETFQGKVKNMSDAMDAATRQAEVEIEAVNPQKKLKPGMFARVTLSLEPHPKAIVIPREALAETGETRYAFVVENGKARRRDVREGLRFEKEVEILGGLTEGEEVVTIGWQNLTDGTPVDVVERK